MSLIKKIYSSFLIDDRYIHIQIRASLMAQAVKNLSAVPEAQEMWVRSLDHGEGNDYSLQYSCLENPMDRGARRTIVQKVAESDTI